jgi:hypothetical protein
MSRFENGREASFESHEGSGEGEPDNPRERVTGCLRWAINVMGTPYEEVTAEDGERAVEIISTRPGDVSEDDRTALLLCGGACRAGAVVTLPETPEGPVVVEGVITSAGATNLDACIEL